MNSSYLQFLFAMVLVINGIMCDDDEHQHQHTEDCQQDHSSNQDCEGNGYTFDGSCYLFSRDEESLSTSRLWCNEMSDYHLVFIESAEEQQFLATTAAIIDRDRNYWIGIERGENQDAVWMDGSAITYSNFDRENKPCFQLISSESYIWQGRPCTKRDYYICEHEQANPIVTVTTNGPLQPTSVNLTTTVTTIGPSQPNSVNPTTTVTTIGPSQPNSGKSSTASIVVPPVVLLVAVFLLVALVASIWRKRRNKQTSASNIRSTVNQNEDTVVYNEIGEQDYNTLFGGKEKDDYHEYNVPDRPQGKTSVNRTTASGSGPYQELLKDGTRAVAAVNMSPEVTGPRHGVADDLHAYQDLRQDDRSVSGSHPNGEMPNQLPSKDTPATENGYQALKTATPEYATLEPSPEYATLEQNDQSMTGTSDVSEPPSDKQYDMLQRSLNTVGQPPSAGYGTLKPMNETDADYESPDGQPKATSDV